MRFRCPHQNCPVEVPNDMIGMRIRCPHCEAFFVLDLQYREDSAEQIQTKAPAAAPLAKEPSNLGEQIYDGLPPLSLMIAMRRQKGLDYDDLEAKYQMTPDDWRALDAYESALRAAYSLHTTIALGLFALAANAGNAVIVMNDSLTVRSRGRLEWVTACVAFFLVLCLTVLFLGSRGLRKGRANGIVDFLPAAMSVALLIYLSAAACIFFWVLLGQDNGGLAAFAIMSLGANFTAIGDLGRMLLQVNRALKQIEPPEITNRIVEALKYLE